MAEQARYEVRTPMTLWMVNGAMTSICVLIIGTAIMFEWQVPGFLIFLMSLVVTATIAFWFSMTAYRVGGGRNLIRFYGDRVEVPGPSKRQPLVFPRDGLALDIRDVVVKYRVGIAATVGSVRRGKLIELRHRGVARKLSTLTLADESDEAALVADFRLFAAGQPAIGRAGHSVPPPRTPYDERLDRELAALD
jgi:hypothetical protein